MQTVLLTRIVKAKHIDGFRRQALNEATLIALERLVKNEHQKVRVRRKAWGCSGKRSVKR